MPYRSPFAFTGLAAQRTFSSCPPLPARHAQHSNPSLDLSFPVSLSPIGCSIVPSSSCSSHYPTSLSHRPLRIDARSQSRVVCKNLEMTDADSLTLPSLALAQNTKHPTPFEIFHFEINAPLTTAIVKTRYYDLCKKYHPDLKHQSTSTAVDTSVEFKAIVEAYDLLRSASKRSIYLRSGYGWTAKAKKPPGARNGFDSGYDFSRGPSMRPGGAGAYRGAYPSAAYDSAYWTDPFNPHFRPDPAGGNGGPPRGGSATGWGNKGMIGTNGGIFLALLSLTVRRFASLVFPPC